MGSLAKTTTATIIPCLRYRNAPAAIDWLCETFGFERQLVVPRRKRHYCPRSTPFRQRNDHARLSHR